MQSNSNQARPFKQAGIPNRKAPHVHAISNPLIPASGGLSSWVFSAMAFAAPLPALADEVEIMPLKTIGGWEVGQVEQANSYAAAEAVDKEVINRATVWTLQEAKIGDFSKVSLGVGGGYFFVYPRGLGRNPYTHTKRSGFGLTDAHGEFLIAGESLEGDHWLLARAGIFNFKYNPDSKNLGEYLFRAWTYPMVLTTGGLSVVRSAASQLSGLDLQTRQGGFENHAMLTLQTERAPVKGLVFTDIASFTFGGFFTLGAGIQFDNFYVANPEEVTPEGYAANRYFTLSDGTEMAVKEFNDLTTLGLIPTGVTIVDTSYYSLAGSKAMVRTSLNLRALTDEALDASPFGLYFEADLIGIENRPTYYEKPADRMVYLFGADIPTFGFLDLMSFEAEFSPNPWASTSHGPYGNGTAIPFVDDFTETFPNGIKNVDEDNWKWTFLAEKRINALCKAQLQVANDHLRTVDVFGSLDFYDFMRDPAHWYWMLRLEFAI